jgi:hypothetical protein
MQILTQVEIEDKLRGEDLDTWLDLWRTEQGPAKPAALKLITAVIPFPIDRSLRVLDVGCGPGDAGRAIYSRFPHARIDFVDRNELFVSLCGAVNRRDGIGGRTWMADLSEPNWRRDLASDYGGRQYRALVQLGENCGAFRRHFSVASVRWRFSAYGTGRTWVAVCARFRGVAKGTAKPAQV